MPGRETTAVVAAAAAESRIFQPIQSDVTAERKRIDWGLLDPSAGGAVPGTPTQRWCFAAVWFFLLLLTDGFWLSVRPTCLNASSLCPTFAAGKGIVCGPSVWGGTFDEFVVQNLWIFFFTKIVQQRGRFRSVTGSKVSVVSDVWATAADFFLHLVPALLPPPPWCHRPDVAEASHSHTRHCCCFFF